ncbi:hypothetical protein BDA99DRAFT_533660 [Phascolomyces articulosus]|uniref:Uncharacterized protein n=1 Tax=Phascolomyces articulosus TaxID=60185 RepID=A0AAD5KP94_9FUNG|nr:hypothetical protein BDA99DRAFT_533660 [Phascolomyces articulosus]
MTTIGWSSPVLPMFGRYNLIPQTVIPVVHANISDPLYLPPRSPIRRQLRWVDLRNIEFIYYELTEEVLISAYPCNASSPLPVRDTIQINDFERPNGNMKELVRRLHYGQMKTSLSCIQAQLILQDSPHSQWFHDIKIFCCGNVETTSLTGGHFRTTQCIYKITATNFGIHPLMLMGEITEKSIYANTLTTIVEML